MTKPYYITTPIFYVNAAPHIGHAYTQIACDTLARYLRQRRREVFFMTGTDEHGEKIEKATVAAGFREGEEKKFVDTIIPRFIELWRRLNVKYDRFIRTTDEEHVRTVRQFMGALHKKGDIYKKEYKGWFCTPCEMFWSDSQAPGGVCPDCKRPAEKLDEVNYFFKMSSYGAGLIEAIEKGEFVIRPEMRKNEVLSFLKGNTLQDLCISRPKSRLKWGIELPFDSEYVAYVWVDALINYVSGIGYSDDRRKFESLWPADVHVIGKDIIRHHAIYWPIMLMALGENMPGKVFAHGWWVVEGDKMSKSKGNVVDPFYLMDEKKYPVDALRYFLMSQVQFGWDGSFSEPLLVEKYNSDLANDIGNLLNRTLTMVEKYFGAAAPDTQGAGNLPELLGEEAARLGREIKESASALPGFVDGAMDPAGDGPDFQKALSGIWKVIGKSNKYIEVSAPWKHSKENNMKAIAVIMDTLLQGLGIAACLLYPFMPDTSENMWKQLGGEGSAADKAAEGITWGIIPAGSRVNKTAPLFPRLEQIK